MKNERWVDSVIEALQSLENQQGNLTKDIYPAVRRIRQNRGLSWAEHTVRATIYANTANSSDKIIKTGLNIFKSIRKGAWGLQDEYMYAKAFGEVPVDLQKEGEIVKAYPIVTKSREESAALSQDGKQLPGMEEVKIRKIHYIYEGRLAQKDIKQIKIAKGYTCEACGMSFANRYPGLGADFIECHHKVPYANLTAGESRKLNLDDFMVLCSNCHKMIHRLENPGDLDGLRAILAKGN